MSFQPVVPFSGYAGWTFLQRTRAAQQSAFDASAQIQRDTAYFKEKIGGVKTAEDLVSDRRLLSVALGAYGLDQDINSKFFVKKVLEDGSFDGTDLANRLSDKRYLAMTKAFGFGDFPIPNTGMSDFGDSVVTAYRQRQFEIAIGEQNEDLRLATGFARDLGTILKSQSTADGRWFAVMGNAPVRRVIETALGLPASFGRLDLDQQLSGFREAAQRQFGDGEVAGLSDPVAQEKLIRNFLIRSEAQASASTGSGQIALTLLQSARR
jgi:hypothetical protein